MSLTSFDEFRKVIAENNLKELEDLVKNYFDDSILKKKVVTLACQIGSLDVIKYFHSLSSSEIFSSSNFTAAAAGNLEVMNYKARSVIKI